MTLDKTFCGLLGKRISCKSKPDPVKTIQISKYAEYCKFLDEMTQSYGKISLWFIKFSKGQAF